MRKTVAIATLLIAGACSRADNQSEAPADTAAATVPVATDTAPAPAAAAATVSDPQNAAIVVAANDVDIKAGELAVAHATDARVKEFAQRMITDHSGVNKAATDLVTRLHVTPEANPTSEDLTRNGELSRSSLERETGAAFDRAYIDHEVEYHQSVLNAIDTILIPSAQNAELKQLLQQTRPAIEAHLQHARQLQSALAGG
jgi:putative membrane protein